MHCKSTYILVNSFKSLRHLSTNNFSFLYFLFTYILGEKVKFWIFRACCKLQCISFSHGLKLRLANTSYNCDMQRMFWKILTAASLYSCVTFPCGIAGTILLTLVFAVPYSHSLMLRQHDKAKGKHIIYQTTGITACTSSNKNGQVTDTGLGPVDV